MAWRHSCLALVQNPCRRIPSPSTVALLAIFGPCVGLHGLPRLVNGDRSGGLFRLIAGLLLIGVVVLGAGELIGLLLFDPVALLFLVLLFGGGYAFLWGEGVAYALRRLPPA
jgi:hypothetical protein